MKQIREWALSLFVYCFLAILIAGFETTIWNHFFSSIPSPLLWLSIVTFIVLNQDQSKGIIHLYAITLGLIPFTSLSFGKFTLCLLATHFVLYMIKERIQWSSLGYFIIMVLVTHITFFISQILVGYFFEDVSLSNFNFLDWILQILLAPFTTVPIYYLLQWIEGFLTPQIPMHTGESEL